MNPEPVTVRDFEAFEKLHGRKPADAHEVAYDKRLFTAAHAAYQVAKANHTLTQLRNLWTMRENPYA